MNNRGFTLVELLATIIILALVSGISIVGVMASQENAKKKLENNFMNDVGNAIDMYISMNTDSLKFGSNSVGKINKEHGVVNVYVTIKSFDEEETLEEEPLPESSEYVRGKLVKVFLFTSYLIQSSKETE